MFSQVGRVFQDRSHSFLIKHRYVRLDSPAFPILCSWKCIHSIALDLISSIHVLSFFAAILRLVPPRPMQLALLTWMYVLFTFFIFIHSHMIELTLFYGKNSKLSLISYLVCRHAYCRFVASAVTSCKHSRLLSTISCRLSWRSRLLISSTCNGRDPTRTTMVIRPVMAKLVVRAYHSDCQCQNPNPKSQLKYP